MSSTATRVGLLLTVLVLAAGCGGTGGTEGDGPNRPPPAPERIPTGAPAPTGRPVPAEPDPLVANPPAGATAVPAEQVDVRDLPPGFPTLMWTRGPRVLGVYGRAGGCTAARAEVVEQTPERVAVRVVQFSTGPGPCTRELVYPALEVALDADLGSRRVVLTGTAA